MNSDLISVIIPAHNEEAVIRRTLATLLQTADYGEFEVIVVCNGCSDRTAEIVAGEFASVRVLELEEASKTAAINAGFRRAQGRVVLLLDADIELETRSARALADAASRPGVEVAIGHMDVDVEGASLIVRAFYRIWMEHPYLRGGKFAAAIALSRDGLTRIGAIPAVTADDTYLRRLFPADRVAVVESVRFKVRAPRTLKALVSVRSRSYRGTRQLASFASVPEKQKREAQGLLRRLFRKPALWPLLPVYAAITLAAKGLSHRGGGTRWERDLTTRTPSAQ
jgi:glycosyltransferase involved in cell wall biosynthesis